MNGKDTTDNNLIMDEDEDENGKKLQNGKKYIWYWKDLNNNWQEFPPNMQTKINNLSVDNSVLSFHTASHDYIITKTSEAKGIQTNCDTNSQRPIKRRIKSTKKLKKKKEIAVINEEYAEKRAMTKKERRKQREQRQARGRKKKASKVQY